jgi:DNA end-binding protein Ku
MAASTWRGRIAFGMVSIPVRLYKAARRERIRFHNVYRPERVEAEVEDDEPPTAEPPRRGPRLVAPADPTPVETEMESAPVERVRSMPMMSPQTGDAPSAPLPKDQILKAFELEKDRYVVFEQREIAALRPRTSSELAIDEFVRLAEIDPVFFETSYYVEPDAGGEKPYTLLFAALSDSGYAALGTFAMHGREHAAVIRPGRRGLILHTLFYANEVRAEGEYSADRALVGDKERQLAVTLVEALAGPFEAAKLKSGQEERLRELIESRAPRAVAAAGAEPPRAATPAVDIMEALRKSLAAARKPAASETRPANPQAARRTRKK